MNALLDRLRALPTMVQLSTKRSENHYVFSLLKEGFTKSGLVELRGPLGGGKTEVVLRFLSENPFLKAVWLEKEFTFNPTTLREYGVRMDQVLFLDLSSPDLKQTPLWCASQVLKSGFFQVMILSQLNLNEKNLRRLQLLSKGAGCLIFILIHHDYFTDARGNIGSWTLTLQAEVRRAGPHLLPHISILKNRFYSYDS